VIGQGDADDATRRFVATSDAAEDEREQQERGANDHEHDRAACAPRPTAVA
jgi:hypothetical protein